MTSKRQIPDTKNYPPTTWWGQQWQERLEQQADSNKMQRAYKYLRAEIATIQELGPDEITGQIAVQESPPYVCSIKISRLSDNAKQIISQQLADRPGFAYQLANREIPPELDQILNAYGEHIVPQPYDEIITCCSCPDTAPPCTHSAAVYMIARQRFEQNPMLLLKSRGIDVDALDTMIQESAQEIKKWGSPQPEIPPETDRYGNPTNTTGAREFWADDLSALTAIVIPPAAKPDITAESIHRLGNFPGWQSEIPFIETMENIYRTNAEHISTITGKAEQNKSDGGNLPA